MLAAFEATNIRVLPALLSASTVLRSGSGVSGIGGGGGGGGSGGGGGRRRANLRGEDDVTGAEEHRAHIRGHFCGSYRFCILHTKAP